MRSRRFALDDRLPEIAKLPAPDEPVEVASEEDLDVDAVGAASLACLAPLPIRQHLAHDGAFEIQVELGEVEVRSECLSDRPVGVSFEDEGSWLVLPGDAVLVEEPCQLALDRVGELRRRDARTGRLADDPPDRARRHAVSSARGSPSPDASGRTSLA